MDIGRILFRNTEQGIYEQQPLRRLMTRQIYRTYKFIPNIVIQTLLVTLFMAFPVKGGLDIDLPTPLELALITEIKGDVSTEKFYLERNFEPIWLGEDQNNQKRLKAFIQAIENLATHGLTTDIFETQFDWDESYFANDFEHIASTEIHITRLFLRYAKVINSGYLKPSEVSELIDIDKLAPLPSYYLLKGITENNPETFLLQLAPQNDEYTVLRKTLYKLRKEIESGGWGEEILASELLPGQEGSEVIKLRNRLIRMGYLPRSGSTDYNLELKNAVQLFQLDHGLTPNGFANYNTIEAINVSPEAKLESVIVALERNRWMNKSLGPWYVIVNIPEFTARFIEQGEVKFETGVVVGKNKGNLQTPEFSDEMEYIVINPIWHVPASIIIEEIIPRLRRNLESEPFIAFFDRAGNSIDRTKINFSRGYSKSSLNFTARQLPGPTNPLGGVKFMFPNSHNIYLHDSPIRNLFDRDYRAYSHGCIRLKKAHDFARFLLTMEGLDYDTLVARSKELKGEQEVQLTLNIPVHITYRTVWVTSDGRVNYRKDLYERDKLVYNALTHNPIFDLYNLKNHYSELQQ